MKISHTSAKPTHYDKESRTYDLFNDKNSLTINKTLQNFLKKQNVKSVLDLSCGTGSQVFWLSQKGFEVTGVDINKKMLKIARSKAKSLSKKIQFIEGDMRGRQVGQFDSVITIFNSIGHLTKTDFQKAIRNVYRNLKPGGIYIFDIYNFDYLLYQDNITKLTIDWLKKKGSNVTREIQYSTINKDGILASFDFYYETDSKGRVKSSQATQTLQTYNKPQLTGLLQSNGFKVVQFTTINGRRFSKTKSDRILVVAKKQGINNK